MPRELYNEGRVVGYSAYEMYVRHHLKIDPNHPVATEKEWLASMMAMGSSMLLRIGKEETSDNNNTTHFIDVAMPENSRLCAANCIIASFFSGKGDVQRESSNDEDGTSTGWVTKVTDYGPLIENDSTKHPNGEVKGTITKDNINSHESVNFDDETISQMKEYMKIIDGIVIQPGTWTVNSQNPPYEDFKPELSKSPTLRISFSDKIEKPFYVLFTGFTNRTVVDGQTGFDSAINTKSPDDGDFLGPWAFPWSAKIFFHVPTSFFTYFMKNNYSRKLPKESEAKTVQSDAIIDMVTTNPANSYSDDSYFKDAPVSVEVTNLHTLGKDAAVLATYRKNGEESTDDKKKLPSALYGAVISETDKNSNGSNTKYNPIDIVAPGTIKLYHISNSDTNALTEEKSKELVSYLEKNTPYNYGFYRDNGNYVIYEYDPKNAEAKTDDYIPVSDDETINVNGLQTYNTKYIWLNRSSGGFWYKFTNKCDGNPTSEDGSSCDGCSSYSSETQTCNKGYKRTDSGVIAKQGTGNDPAFFEMKDVRSFTVGMIRSGQFSQEFLNKYGIDFETGTKYKDALGKCNCNLYGEYWKTISETEKDKYQYIFTGPKSYEFKNNSSTIISCIIVRKEDGAVANMSYQACEIKGMTTGFDFAHGVTGTVNETGGNGTENIGSEENPYSEAYVKQKVKTGSTDKFYDKSLTRYLGSWWARPCPYGNSKDGNCETLGTTCKWKGYGCHCLKDFGGNVVYNGHKSIAEAIPEYKSFYSPDTDAPDAAGVSFGDSEDPNSKKEVNYLDWLYNTPLSDLIKKTGQTADSLGIHSDYRDLMLGDFLQKASVRYINKADTDDNNWSESTEETLYVYSKDCLEKVCSENGSSDSDENSVSVDKTKKLYASARITIPGTRNNFFASRFWKIEETDNTEGNFENVRDITKWSNRTNTEIYASKGTSGHHQTNSISVVDASGAILQFAGTGSVVKTDYITWIDLLNALDHNKKIDILEDILRGLKVNLTGSGVNYLEFKGSTDNGNNKIRVYFSKTAPTATNGDSIPDGSIGIGW